MLRSRRGCFQPNPLAGNDAGLPLGRAAGGAGEQGTPCLAPGRLQLHHSHSHPQQWSRTSVRAGSGLQDLPLSCQCCPLGRVVLAVGLSSPPSLPVSDNDSSEELAQGPQAGTIPLWVRVAPAPAVHMPEALLRLCSVTLPCMSLPGLGLAGGPSSGAAHRRQLRAHAVWVKHVYFLAVELELLPVAVLAGRGPLTAGLTCVQPDMPEALGGRSQPSPGIAQGACVATGLGLSLVSAPHRCSSALALSSCH